MDRCIITLDV